MVGCLPAGCRQKTDEVLAVVVKNTLGYDIDPAPPKYLIELWRQTPETMIEIVWNIINERTLNVVGETVDPYDEKFDRYNQGNQQIDIAESRRLGE